MGAESMAWICRILFLLAFTVFWGGLTFYLGFVVRISHDVLNDPMDGGIITQRVTALLEILCLVTVGLMALNAYFVTQHARRLGYALWVCAGLVGSTLVALHLLHGQMDAVIDVGNFEIVDREVFERGHRHHKQATTLQWIASLGYFLITVYAWRMMDGEVHRPSERDTVT